MSAAVHIFESPLGVVRSLGARVWYVLPGCAGVLAAYSYFPKPTLPGEPGGQNLADFAAVALSSVCCTLAGCLLFATNIWWDLSINFDVAPWRAGQDGALTVTPGGADSTPLECPFYRSENPEAQCCACGTLVSRSGLHEERVVSLGDLVLDWGRAMHAVERTDDTANARFELDAALDFTGNPALCQVSRCCLGCYMYQRCHNLLPRLAQICMYASMCLALAPWAAWKMFSSLPPGFNGLAGVLSAFWACSALLLVLDSIATPMAFMKKYSWLPFPYPQGVFNDRWRDVLCGLFSAPLP